VTHASEPDRLWWDFWWGSDRQMLQHASWAWVQVQGLPMHSEDERLPRQVQIACLEAFLINARMLFDFLTKKNAKDFSAWDLVPTWDPQPQDVVDRLGGGVWLIASRHVAHPSRERIAESPSDLEPIDVSRAALEAIRDDLGVLYQPWHTLAARALNEKWDGRQPEPPGR
jgi:hypothetical protein